jgi:SpoVK/Ycf46/Vps4 family AAA+-type ATPase
MLGSCLQASASRPPRQHRLPWLEARAANKKTAPEKRQKGKVMRMSHLSWAINTPETRYLRQKTASWLLALSQNDMPMDGSFFQCLEWVLGGPSGLRRLLPRADNSLIEPRRTYSRNLYDELAEMAADPSLSRHLGQTVREACAALSQGSEEDNRFGRGSKNLKRVFGLSAQAHRLCEFIFITQSCTPVKAYFDSTLSLTDAHGNRSLLALVLDIPGEDIHDCLEELCLRGLLSVGYRSLCLPEKLLFAWENSQKLSEGLFYQPLRGKALPLEAFHLPQEVIRHTCALLKAPGDQPVHILLYGPAGCGKTTFARSLAAALHMRAWTVISRDDDSEGERRASLSACLHLTAAQKNCFVLVDEAESLLDTRGVFGKGGKNKAWLNAFLEKPGRKVLWITNHIEHIEQAVRRRFSFSIHFPELTKRERKAIWQDMLDGHKAAAYLSPPQLQELIGRYEVPAAVIEKAVWQAKKTAGKRNFAAALQRVLQAHVTLSQGGREDPARKPAASPEYMVEGICTGLAPRELLDACRKIDARLRAGLPGRPGCATMLFYGPPGSGKTALARYIAQELERECLVKRASDLISPWLGMTEKNIAAAFAQAAREEAVLVIDEADSFIFSRRMAQRSWEFSFVNEFLTALEECRTFCICTTNQRENLDPAAMRRFSFKVPFNYIGPKQIMALYDAMLAPLAKGALPPAQESALRGLARLTPGDFHSVRSRRWLDKPASVSHAQLVRDLSAEQEMKLEEPAKRVGFH